MITPAIDLLLVLTLIWFSWTIIPQERALYEEMCFLPPGFETNITNLPEIPANLSFGCDPIIINNTVIVQERPFYERIIDDAREGHEYNQDYTCVTFTKTALQGLKHAGYMAREVQGKCNYTKGLHSWVEVNIWIEPQNGEVIPMGVCYENR